MPIKIFSIWGCHGTPNPKLDIFTFLTAQSIIIRINMAKNIVKDKCISILLFNYKEKLWIDTKSSSPKPLKKSSWGNRGTPKLIEGLKTIN